LSYFYPIRLVQRKLQVYFGLASIFVKGKFIIDQFFRVFELETGSQRRKYN
jgi:hypothetical protein